MKNKVVDYFKPDDTFMATVEKIKQSGRRLSNREKQKLLEKAKKVIYK